MSTHISHPPSRPIGLGDKGLRHRADMLVELGWLISGPYVWDISWENADWAPLSLLSHTFLIVNLGLLHGRPRLVKLIHHYSRLQEWVFQEAWVGVVNLHKKFLKSQNITSIIFYGSRNSGR